MSENSIWTKWKVALRINRIYGGQPVRPDVYDKWLEMRGFRPAEIKAKIEEARAAGTITDEDEGRGCTTFPANDDGPYLDAYQVKAMMREAMTVTGMAKKHRGLRQALQHGVFVSPQEIPLGRDIEGAEEKIVHAMTPKGKIAAFQRSDFIVDADVEFEVKTCSPMFFQTTLTTLLEVGSEIGLGANRTRGKSKFEVLEIEKMA